MTLSSYLKQFKNIAWYPSALKDSLSMVCLSQKSLLDYDIPKSEAPDVYIFTDYETYKDQEPNNRFFLDLKEDELETNFYYTDDEFKATAFNIKELEQLHLPFDKNMVAFERDEYYGRAFIADILIEHQKIGKTIAKLVYVIIENTSFAFNFLLKRNIKIRYMIHSRYGHGFGGGISNGGFMCNIMKDLGTRYIACDFNKYYNHDVADIYLTGIQRNTIPILRKIDNFAHKYKWAGYDDTILYEVIGFTYLDSEKKDNTRFVISNGNERAHQI